MEPSPTHSCSATPVTPSSAAGTNVYSEGPEMNTQTAKVEIDPETEETTRAALEFGVWGGFLVLDCLFFPKD